LEDKRTTTIVLLGPTASGKTAAAVALAEKIGGEIVSADAFQVYRGMDVATAKPSPDLLRRVPHHLIDIIPLDEVYTAARFRALALAALEEIRGRGRTPLVVGGAAMYITALTDGLCSAPSADPEIRVSLAEEEKKLGPGHLHRKLAAVDPVSSERIHPRNIKRIIRALEVFQLTGEPISRLQVEWTRNRGNQGNENKEFVLVGMKREREDLQRRIEQRVERMFESGLVEETRRLRDQGAGGASSAWMALGYREVEGYLRGEYSQSEARKRLVVNTRRFARRQMIWWKRDERIIWVDVSPEEKPEETAETMRLNI
jgi:tRNA dimethylallyltransferase